MSLIAFANNEASSLHIYEKTDTVSIISEQPSYVLKERADRQRDNLLDIYLRRGVKIHCIIDVLSLILLLKTFLVVYLPVPFYTEEFLYTL